MPQDSPYVSVTLGGKKWKIPRSSLPQAQARGAVLLHEDPTNVGAPTFSDKAETFGRETTLGAFSGAGVAETQTPVKDTVKNLLTTNPSMASALLGPGYDIGKGLATSGAEFAEGLGADPKHPGAFNPVQLDKVGHGIGSLLTQLLLLRGGKEAAEKPISSSEVVRGGKAVGDAVVEGPPKIVQAVTGAKSATNKAERLAGEKAVKESAEGKQKYVDDLAKNREEKLQQSRKETTDKAQGVLRKKTQKELTDNLKKTDEMIDTSFKAEYEDARKKLFGVEKETRSKRYIGNRPGPDDQWSQRSREKHHQRQQGKHQAVPRHHATRGEIECF